MSLMKSGSAIYRPDLGTAVMEYYEVGLQGFIGLEVMPIFRSGVQSSSYPVIPKEALLKLTNVDRAPRAAYARDDWQAERGYFATSEKGREELLDDSERALFDQEAPGVAEEVATRRAYMAIMRAQEKRIADIFDTASNFATDDVTATWSSYTTATPVQDVRTAISTFRTNCGMLPDALIMDWAVKEHVKNCDEVKDQLKYTFPGIDISNIDAPQLARLFGVPRVMVAGAVYDSAGKGVASSVAGIWSAKKVWLAKIGAGMDLMQPCVGRTFLWTADSPTNPIVEQYRAETNRSDVFRVRHHVSEELIASRNTSGTVVSNISSACCKVLSGITT